MEGGGYWTDSSSLDALSTCSDAEDVKDKDKTLTSAQQFDNNNPFATPTPTPQQNDEKGGAYQSPRRVYVVGHGLRENEEFKEALEVLGIVPVWINDGEGVPDIDHFTSIVVFQDFKGPVFESLRRKSTRLRIFGPMIIIDAGRTKNPLPVLKNGYPLYSNLLKNCKVCATGIKTKEELVEIRRKVLYLDGIFVEREGSTMTHLIAAKCRGNKYRDAVALDKPILKQGWIDFLWSHKGDVGFDVNTNIESFKVRAFYGSRIALDGFDDAERSGMIKLVEENEGTVVESSDPTATHIVKSSSLSGLDLGRCLSPLSDAKGMLKPSTPDATLLQAQKSPLKRPRLESSVLNDANEAEAKMLLPGRAKILKAEWFWTSIQIEACADESAYQIGGCDMEETLNNSVGTSFCSPVGPFSDTDGGTPHSSSISGRRKRKRLMRDFVSSLAQVEHPKLIMEVDEEAENFADLVKSPEQSQDNVDDSELIVIIKRIEKSFDSQQLKDLRTKMITEAPQGKAAKRLNEFLHMIETEKNYVSILMHIIKLFKEPCEADDQKAGRILSSLEIKQIFGPILPIYELHKRVLRDMLHVLENYSEQSLIGQIYVKNADELRKCYEPFVGYFETVKNEIIRCEMENPRFMAFLRIAQAKPQCGKEKLVELIIRPVQRLPSTALVLKNLAKSTERSNPDYEWITRAVESIDRVNQTVNQEKKRTDDRYAIFGVYNEVEGCPVELISDHRTLLKKYDVTVISYELKILPNSSASSSQNYKHEPFTLIVFSDHFLVVKRRPLASSKTSATLSLANLRSPAVGRKSIKFNTTAPAKLYKYVESIYFNHVRRVVNVVDAEPGGTARRTIAFVVLEPTAMKERILHFTLPEDFELERTQKLSVAEFFAKLVSHSVQRVDFEYYLTTVDTNGLHLHSRGVSSNGGVIARSIKKVGRALSLSRTPSLKRTMSQIISSPFTSRNKDKDPDAVSQSGSEHSFTPIRNHLSTISLFGTKRGVSMADGHSTPKTRKTIFDKDAMKSFPTIDESFQ